MWNNLSCFSFGNILSFFSNNLISLFIDKCIFIDIIFLFDLFNLNIFDINFIFNADFLLNNLEFRGFFSLNYLNALLDHFLDSDNILSILVPWWISFSWLSRDNLDNECFILTGINESEFTWELIESNWNSSKCISKNLEAIILIDNLECSFSIRIFSNVSITDDGVNYAWHLLFKSIL